MPLRFPAEVTAIIRAELFGGLAGALEDLKTPEKLRDPAANARDAVVFARLLEALDQREIVLPDEEARARIELLADNYDETYEYLELTSTHDAQHALLDVLGGADRGGVR